MSEVKTQVVASTNQHTGREVLFFIESKSSCIGANWQWNLHAESLFCSDVMWTADTGHHTKVLLHPDDKAGVKKALAELQNGEEPDIKFRVITSYGEVVTVKASAPFSFNIPEVLPATAGAAMEWAEKRWLQQQLVEASLQFRSYSQAEEVAGMGHWWYNSATGEVRYSDGVFRLFKIPAQSLNSHLLTFQSFIHPDDRAIVTEVKAEAILQKFPFQMEYRVVCSDGTENQLREFCRWEFNDKGQMVLYGSFFLLNEMVALEQKAQVAAEKLALERKKLRLAEETSGIGVFEVNMFTRHAWVSDSYYRLLGLKPGSKPPGVQTLFSQIHPDDRAEVQKTIIADFASHQITEMTFRLARPDGKVRTVRRKGRVLTNEKGHPVAIGILQDVTRQLVFEKELERMKADVRLMRLGQLLQDAATNSATWYWNLADNTVRTNNHLWQLLGTRPDATGFSWPVFLRLVLEEDRLIVQDCLKAATKSTEEQTCRFRILRKGELRHIGAVLQQHADEKASWLVISLHDVTDTHQLQKAMEAKEKFAQSLADNTINHILVTDVNHQIQLWNRAFEETFDISRGKAVGKNLFEIFPALQNETIIADLNKALAGENLVLENHRLVGTKEIVNIHLSPIHNDEGTITGVLHVLQNTSREFHLREQLTQRLAFIENLLEHSVDRIIVLDRHLNYQYWNRRAEDYYGITRNEVIGRNILELFPAFAADPSYPELRRVLRGETVYIPAQETLAEKKAYYETYLVPLKTEMSEVSGVLWIVHDLTKEYHLQEVQKLAQRQLEAEHRRLKEAQAIGRVGSFAWEVGSEVSLWSDELYRINGLEPGSEEITLDKIDQFIHPEDFVRLQELKKAFARKPGHYKMLHRIVRRDGEVRWINHQWENVADENGLVVRVTGIVQDITGQVQAEEQLRKNESLLRSTELAANTGSYEADLVQDVFHFSDGMYHLFGEEPGSLEMTMNWIDSRSHPDDVPVVKTVLDTAVATTQPYTYQRRIYRKNGELRTMEAQGRVICNAQGNAVKLIGLVQDITERKKAEEQIQAQAHYLRRITETVPDMMSVMELATRNVHYLNRDTFIAQGFHPDIMLQKTAEERSAMIHPDDRMLLNTYFSKLSQASDEEMVTAEYRAQDISGNWKWFHVRGKVFQRDANGKVTHVLNAIDNITARKNSEEEILRLKDEVAKKATDKYYSLFNAIDEGFYQAEVMFDENEQVIDLLFSEENPAAVRMMGQSFVGKTLKEINPGYEPHWFQLAGRVALTGNSERIELYSGPDNKWFNSYITKVGDRTSRQIAIVFQDVTDRKKAEDQVKAVNTRLVDVLESTADAFYALDADFNFTYINRKAEQLWNRSAASLIGKHYWTEFPKAVGTESYRKHQEAMETGMPLHYQTISPLVGIWIEVSIYPVKEGGLSVFFSDITLRKEAEDQLRNFTLMLEQQVAERTSELQKSNTILQQAEELSQMGSWEYIINTGEFNWSKGKYELFGLPQGMLVKPETYLEFVVEEDKAVAKLIIKQLKKTHQSFEEMLQIKRGEKVRLLKVKGSVTVDGTGKPQKIIGVDIDLTDIKEAEEKFATTQRMLEQMALASPDVITIYDLQNKQPVYLNHCLAEWTGKTPDELVSMGIEGRLRLIHPDDRLRLLHFNEKLAMAKDGDVLNLEYRILTTDEDYCWLRNRSKVFERNAAGKVTHVLSILQDISEEKAGERLLKSLNTALEKQNRELEAKNDQITSFAFVASHDLKEPIRKIHTFSDWLLQRETNLSEGGRQNLNRLQNAAERLNILVDDILALTKVHVDKVSPVDVDLNFVLKLAEKEMHELLVKTGAEIKADKLPKIKGVENLLLYLFKNLLGNSIKFQSPANKPVIHISSSQEEGTIKLVFTDNGIGFSPVFKKKIFQMFRRLHGKTEFEGTGMGLAICKRIMEKHGGTITAESEEGKGASFTCQFPV